MTYENARPLLPALSRRQQVKLPLLPPLKQVPANLVKKGKIMAAPSKATKNSPGKPSPTSRPAAAKARESAQELHARLVGLLKSLSQAPDKKAGALISKEALAALKSLKGLLDKAERKIAGIKKITQK
jgi:hypothetical protein